MRFLCLQYQNRNSSIVWRIWCLLYKIGDFFDRFFKVFGLNSAYIIDIFLILSVCNIKLEKALLYGEFDVYFIKLVKFFDRFFKDFCSNSAYNIDAFLKLTEWGLWSFVLPSAAPSLVSLAMQTFFFNDIATFDGAIFFWHDCAAFSGAKIRKRRRINFHKKRSFSHLGFANHKVRGSLEITSQ